VCPQHPIPLRPEQAVRDAAERSNESVFHGHFLVVVGHEVDFIGIL
jgi:hypothetical protein